MSVEVEVGWVIVELMGRTRVAGRLTRDEIGLRLDMPATPGQPATTHWYGPTSWFGIHAVDEATARECAAAWRPEPVRRWELPAAVHLDPWDDKPDLTEDLVLNDEGSDL